MKGPARALYPAAALRGPPSDAPDAQSLPGLAATSDARRLDGVRVWARLGDVAGRSAQARGDGSRKVVRVSHVPLETYSSAGKPEKPLGWTIRGKAAHAGACSQAKPSCVHATSAGGGSATGHARAVALATRVSGQHGLRADGHPRFRRRGSDGSGGAGPEGSVLTLHRPRRSEVHLALAAEALRHAARRGPRAPQASSEASLEAIHKGKLEEFKRLAALCVHADLAPAGRAGRHRTPARPAAAPADRGPLPAGGAMTGLGRRRTA